MSVSVDVWSDFVCPFCFLVSTSLKRLEETHDIELTWHAFELRPFGSPPPDAQYRQFIAEKTPAMVAMAKAQYGVDIQQGPFGIDSRWAHRATKWAEQQGAGNAFAKAVLAAYWLQGQDISQIEVLASCAESVGLNASNLAASLAEPLYDEAVEEDIALAQQLRLSGVPASVFAKRYLVVGAQPYDVFADVLQQALDPQQPSN